MAKHTNRLAKESSPYLLQHAHNPVDWFPWGDEALTRSKKENRLIFLSIGYSACHWCHVMEKESFEDESTADLLNANFINIKVDREERPDLDHIYMAAVQTLTQHGGWPMSVFLTPDLKPFYGGTYFPPEDRHGLPSFKKIIQGVSGAWKTREDEIRKSAESLVGALEQMGQISAMPAEAGPLDAKTLTEGAFLQTITHFDPEEGGIGRAPKFFHTTEFRLALRHWHTAGNEKALHSVTHTLDRWAMGGIRDHLGGGFHRYSTDRAWLVPHFEKMLYDNALLTVLYLEGYQATKNLEYAKAARETLDYTLREMSSPQGGYYSTQDADSEGVEGKFYVWSREEIFRLLDKDSAILFCKVYRVTQDGNWEEGNILHRRESWESLAHELGQDREWLEETLNASRRKLLQARSTRIKPGKDEKILLSWNGLMLDAMAMGAQVLKDSRYLESAQKTADFLWNNMRDAKGGLLHTHKGGASRLAAYLDDYAFFANGLLTLFESDFNPKWLGYAEEVAKRIVSDFWDEPSQSFFYTAHDHEKLVIRPKEFQDGATPSATGIAVLALCRLGKLLGEPKFLSVAEKTLRSHLSLIQQAPMAAASLILSVEMLFNNSKELVLIPGDSEEDFEDILDSVRQGFHPNKVVAARNEANQELALFRQRKALNGRTTAYLCENLSCRPPVTTLAEIEETL